jgi:3-oxoacyl-[acyl-carrier-protein] synthase-3
MTGGASRDAEDELTPWSHHATIGAAASSGAFQLRQDVDALYRMLPVWLGEFMRLVDEGLIEPDAVDWFCCHYSAHSLREEMIRLATRAGCLIPEPRWYSNLATKGNVGAASIFLIIDDLLRSGDLRDGQKILLAVPESGQCIMAYAGLTVVGGNA